MIQQPSHPGPNPRHVSLVALPDGVVSTLFGIFDVINAFALMDMSNAGPGARAPFHIDLVGEAVGPLETASGVTIDVQRAIDTVEASDIVIVPSVLLRPEGWKKGRYPGLVDWLHRMHDRGAVICSAWSGIFLWPRQDCSTARTLPYTSATPERSRPRIRPSRFIRGVCS